MKKEQAIYILRDCYDKAIKTAHKNADDYINWNPQDKKSRQRDLYIEQIGINNLFYLMLDELNKA